MGDDEWKCESSVEYTDQRAPLYTRPENPDFVITIVTSVLDTSCIEEVVKKSPAGLSKRLPELFDRCRTNWLEDESETQNG